MKIDFSTELMTNQHHAVVMAPQERFEVLQTQQAHGLIFSIGTDRTLYLTREIPGSRAGWRKVDESASIAPLFGGRTCKAKLFDVSQSLSIGTVDIAMAVTIDDADHLVLSLGNPNQDSSWETPLAWVSVPFDAPSGSRSNLVITGIYLAQDKTDNYIVVDILKDPSSPVKTIERYFIDPAPPPSGHHWNKHDLAVSLEAGHLNSALGRKAAQLVDGIYTLGTLVDTTELIYSQIYNPFGGNPLVSRFPLPAGTNGTECAFALGANTSGTTDLYVAATGGLYYLAADAQHDLATPSLIARDALLNGVTELHVDTNNQEIVVWGLNRAGNVFCLRNTVGNQKSPGTWSTPIPILANVLRVSTLLNRSVGGSVVFAHTNDNRLFELIEDPTTTLWSQREIVLPPTDPKDMLTVKTYTTHVQITDDSNLSLPNQTVAFKAGAPCNVYINNEYRVLSDTVPIEIKTDAGGTLTIVQQVDTLGVVGYHLEAGNLAVTIDPMSRAMDKLKKVQSGQDLDVSIPNDKGQKRPLVGPDISREQKDNTARSIAQFVHLTPTLPPDGSSRSKVTKLASRPRAFDASRDRIFGMSFNKETSTYFDSVADAAKAGIVWNDGVLSVFSPTLDIRDVENAITAAAGDIFSWIRHALDKVTQFFVTVIDGVATFFIEIGNALYKFIIDTVRDVANGINFVLAKIKVALDDLIAWLGFLFEWPDIVRTHRVLKTLMKCYVRHAIHGLADTKEVIRNAFTTIENEINAWAHLPPIPTTASSAASHANVTLGQNDPQSNWGTYHLNANAASAVTAWDKSVPEQGTLERLLNEVLAVLEREKDVFARAIFLLQTEVIDKIRTLPISQVLTKVVAIVLDALLETIENVMITTIDIFEILVEGVLEVLDSPIDVPIISQAYKAATGDQLTALDAMCLVAAIPVTLLYKIAEGKTPYPDDEFTRKLIAAKDFTAIQSLFASHAQADLLQSSSALTTLTKVCYYLAIPGAVVLLFTTPFRTQFPNNWPIAIIGSVAYLFYVAPNLPGIIGDNNKKWYNDVNFAITGISVIKTLGDIGLCKYDESAPSNPRCLTLWNKGSPFVECLINALWFAPVIGAIIDSQKAEADVVLCIADSAFNIGGMMALPMSAKDPKIFGAGFVGFIAGDVIYGFLNYILAQITTATAERESLAIA
ncbi:hypothetical protein [Ralstonia sp. 24A2]|uniref:hypothetical protein n=1 Tax=Ralstonia sp. 24A2 TaxID=3447364 RepID=UPI003F6A4270